jgi:hypothetical protein
VLLVAITASRSPSVVDLAACASVVSFRSRFSSGAYGKASSNAFAFAAMLESRFRAAATA